MSSSGMSSNGPAVPNLQVVWFKRDLRTTDHRPLAEAARRGPVLPLYMVEPDQVTAEDRSAAHWAFVRESLQALRRRLAELGQPLVVRTGRARALLERLYRATGGFTLWAHQETGPERTYARDRAVRAWAAERGIPFYEPRQNGVVRGPHDRDEWSEQWEALMGRDVIPEPPALRPVPVRPGRIPTRAELGLRPGPAHRPGPDPQAGGTAAARDVLASFLTERGRHYPAEMSSPRTAFASCSRLSPHLAWGTISIRETLARICERREALEAVPPGPRRDWQRSIDAFASRLRWHDHFTQKLEDAPRIEHESFVPAFDRLREDDHDPARQQAWAAGRTGYPLVDACMRALRATGYLNFRMRALLVSFASYDLWLDWRRFHPVLARRWVDYQPGIHFPQLQMQSATTGINTVRVYNPTKQAREQDPDGAFIRRWVPELEGVPTAYVHVPWLMPSRVQDRAGCRIGEGGDYPAPRVDHAAAAKRARDAIYDLRKRPDVQSRADAVLQQHGSRRRGRRSASTETDDTPAVKQASLDL
jgi:deoxyribodipyrimidine photo-lyase